MAAETLGGGEGEGRLTRGVFWRAFAGEIMFKNPLIRGGDSTHALAGWVGATPQGFDSLLIYLENYKTFEKATFLSGAHSFRELIRIILCPYRDSFVYAISNNIISII